MFEKVTPEQVGIASENIMKYLKVLERAKLSIHDIVMIRHGKVFFECYWKPFHKDFLHRMYSVSKSFVSIAVGFLWQEGLIDLDALAISYLDESITKNANEYVRKQTIRNMLMMSTGKPSETRSWFEMKPEDRLKEYFDESSRRGTPKIPGAFFEYDSPGSFVLASIVEIITGKKMMDYLREKLFDKIDVSKEAYCLSCPGGHSWGDSAVLCTPRDLAKVCMFLVNKGMHNGEQILSREYIEEATGNQICTDEIGHLVPMSYGYGYQIWRTQGNSFYFNGMGSQFAIGIPDKDMVFVINADTQGHPRPDFLMIDRFFEEIVENACDSPLAENKAANDSLSAISENLELFSLKDSIENNMAAHIDGKEFKMKENPMGITKLKFTFNGDTGVMYYTNEQGDKALTFGINKNVFAPFPQEGYSDEIGSKFAPGNYYDCAASAAWKYENTLVMLVQIIDKYLGRLHIRVSFTDNNTVAVFMTRFAEDFLKEYEGYAEGTIN